MENEIILKEPKAILYSNNDILKHMEFCGRLCYNSCDKRTEDSAEKFIDGIIKKGHFTVLEHGAVNIDHPTFMPNFDLIKEDQPEFGLLMAWASLGSVRCADLVKYDSRYSTAASLRNLPRAADVLTFIVDASRSCTHQFVRHRNMSFCERSFRFVEPEKLEVILEEPPTTEQTKLLAESFRIYKESIKAGMSKDEARAYLPMCAATRLVATAQASWWLEFLKLRLHPAASKEIIRIADQIYLRCPDIIKKRATELGLDDQFQKARKKCGIKPSF